MIPVPPLGLQLRESRHTHNANDAHNQTTSTTFENIPHTSRHPLHLRRHAPPKTSRRRDMTPNDSDCTCADHTHRRNVHSTYRIRDNNTRTSRSPTSARNRATIEKPHHVTTCTGGGINVILMMYILRVTPAIMVSTLPQFRNHPVAQVLRFRWIVQPRDYGTPTHSALGVRGPLFCRAINVEALRRSNSHGFQQFRRRKAHQTHRATKPTLAPKAAASPQPPAAGGCSHTPGHARAATPTPTSMRSSATAPPRTPAAASAAECERRSSSPPPRLLRRAACDLPPAGNGLVLITLDYVLRKGAQSNW